MSTMFNEILPKENIKFKELEKKIFRCMNALGCLILRNILEEQIPNQLYFLNKGVEDKLLNKEEEETLCVQDIINKSNIIYLHQECFKIYIDNIILKKEEALFKTTPIKNFLQCYQKELPESFFIKTQSNLLIQMSKIFIDYNLMIDDILTDNSIYIFSMKNKKAIKSQICKNNSLCCLEKIKGNISFTNIQFDKIKIFDKLIPDNEFENYVDESNYEKRRINSLTEYEMYKKINLDEGKIKTLISNNIVFSIYIFVKVMSMDYSNPCGFWKMEFLNFTSKTFLVKTN
jgi:hypothetical protein